MISTIRITVVCCYHSGGLQTCGIQFERVCDHCWGCIMKYGYWCDACWQKGAVGVVYWGCCVMGGGGGGGGYAPSCCMWNGMLALYICGLLEQCVKVGRSCRCALAPRPSAVCCCGGGCSAATDKRAITTLRAINRSQSQEFVIL